MESFGSPEFRLIKMGYFAEPWLEAGLVEQGLWSFFFIQLTELDGLLVDL